MGKNPTLDLAHNAMKLVVERFDSRQKMLLFVQTTMSWGSLLSIDPRDDLSESCFQTQLLLTTCQIRHYNHLWDHRRTGQL